MCLWEVLRRFWGSAVSTNFCEHRKAQNILIHSRKHNRGVGGVRGCCVKGEISEGLGNVSNYACREETPQ